MSFCEDCGSPLTPGVMFCENCGAKISPAAAEQVPADSFPPKDVAEYGIIYTNMSLLSNRLNKSAGELNGIINDFLTTSAARGSGYALCDVSGQVKGLGSVIEHVRLIRSHVERNHHKYLFILGSSSVIPSIVWENRASDSGTDSDVSSDLPYSTLDVNTPFDGQIYDFDQTLRVGRLPDVDFENYFANLSAGCGKCGNVKTFGMSAEVWTAETKDIYKNICAGPAVFNSPDNSKDNVKSIIPPDTNLLLFNLHGSDRTQYWYGQRGGSYPEAVEPGSFSGIRNPYFLAVEACYGAAYEGRDISRSVLLSSLSGKCISFLGSSRIAFGTPAPSGCCADVICGEHLKNLKNGLSAGDSFTKARKALMNGSDDAETIKTLAEFSLYGDPSAVMNGKPVAPKGLFADKNAGKSFSKGITVPLPDVHRAVRLQLVEVDRKIQETAEKFIWSKYTDFNDVKPKFFGSGNRKVCAVFEKDAGFGKKIVTVHMDDNGKIKDYIESK